MALVWPERAEAVVAIQTAARPCRKVELFIFVRTPYSVFAVDLMARLQARHTTSYALVEKLNLRTLGEGGQPDVMLSLRDCAIRRSFCQLKLRARWFYFGLHERFLRQLANTSECGKQDAPDAGNGQCSQAAHDHCAHRAPPLCGHAALELAQLIRRSYKKRIHRAHSTSHGRGGSQLQHRRPDHHAHHV